MIVQHWLIKFCFGRCGRKDAHIIIDDIIQQRARPCYINKERYKVFSEKLHDFKCLRGKHIMMLILLIIEEILIISFHPVSINFDDCLYINIHGYKTYQNIKEAGASVTMMNNNDTTV